MSLYLYAAVDENITSVYPDALCVFPFDANTKQDLGDFIMVGYAVDLGPIDGHEEIQFDLITQNFDTIATSRVFSWSELVNHVWDNYDFTSNPGVEPLLITAADFQQQSTKLSTPTLQLTDSQLVIDDIDENATAIEIYKDGSLYDTIQLEPEPINMPVKGQIITMNLDGEDRLYRVLKVDGNNAEILSMYTPNNATPNSQVYAGNGLDAYLENTWYNSLTDAAKAAIVEKTFRQDSWYTNGSGDPSYSGFYGETAPGTNAYSVSLASTTFGSEITRHAYALSVQDVIDYVTDEAVGDGKLQNYNIWKMFWNQDTKPDTSEYPWLRSADADSPRYLLRVDSDGGNLIRGRVNNSSAARPALTIDLSKIEWR